MADTVYRTGKKPFAWKRAVTVAAGALTFAVAAYYSNSFLFDRVHKFISDRNTKPHLLEQVRGYVDADQNGLSREEIAGAYAFLGKPYGENSSLDMLTTDELRELKDGGYDLAQDGLLLRNQIERRVAYLHADSGETDATVVARQLANVKDGRKLNQFTLEELSKAAGSLYRETRSGSNH